LENVHPFNIILIFVLKSKCIEVVDEMHWSCQRNALKWSSVKYIEVIVGEMHWVDHLRNGWGDGRQNWVECEI